MWANFHREHSVGHGKSLSSILNSIAMLAGMPQHFLTSTQVARLIPQTHRWPQVWQVHILLYSYQPNFPHLGSQNPSVKDLTEGEQSEIKWLA